MIFLCRMQLVQVNVLKQYKIDKDRYSITVAVLLHYSRNTVASVEGNVHGAGVLAYENFMEKASERVGGESFFILPSSIHELLIVPDNGIMDLRHLESMVREVNATTVDPSEKLTDNVYHYDAKEKVFELGEKYVGRQAAKVKMIVLCFLPSNKISHNSKVFQPV